MYKHTGIATYMLKLEGFLVDYGTLKTHKNLQAVKNE